ncbi:MAG: penicillin acylase family protein, partial [Pseudomonadota bacterium]
MVLIFRWLLRLVTGVLVLTGVVVFGLYWLASRSLPDYDATLSVAGLSDRVEIVRDNANVPHIFGETDADAFFALGFVHAQDRLWQMLTLRRTAQGRLSELFGARTVDIDDLMRRLDIYGASVASVADQDAPTTEALLAYAAGVNAWLEEVNVGARGRGAPEFWLFEPVVSPWQPADSIAIGKLMALSLTEHLQEEVLRLRTGLLLPPEMLADILPDVPGGGIAVLPEFAGLEPNGPLDYALYSNPLSPVAARGMNGASNAWAAAPSRSAAGGTLLASDPHLGFEAPAIWYLARLELSTGGVIGGTIPGAPVFLGGRTASLGWGMTASYLDDQDLFLERLNPENRQEVLTDEGFVPLTSRQSIIRIADAAPVTLTLRFSENGPIIPGKHFDLADITPPGHVMALGWTGLSRDDTTLSGLMGLMRAKTVGAAIETGAQVVARQTGPSQRHHMSRGR